MNSHVRKIINIPYFIEPDAFSRAARLLVDAEESDVVYIRVFDHIHQTLVSAIVDTID
jgi:hypothetical protein